MTLTFQGYDLCKVMVGSVYSPVYESQATNRSTSSSNVVVLVYLFSYYSTIFFAAKQQVCHEILNESPTDKNGAASVCETAGYKHLAALQTQPDFDMFVEMIE